MKIKKDKKEVINLATAISAAINAPIYKCEKCGYESDRTFLSIFEGKENRYCLKCVNEFYTNNFPKAVLKK